MSANDDYPYLKLVQNYQKMCDEIDHLRMRLEGMEKREITFRSEIDVREAIIHELRDMDAQAGDDIEQLNDFNRRLLEALSDMTGIGPGYPLCEFTIKDAEPEIVNLLEEGGIRCK